MGKRHKNHPKPAVKSPRRDRTAADSDGDDRPPALVPHPPAKQPVLLGISIVLFVLWLLFLLVTSWPR